MQRLVRVMPRGHAQVTRWRRGLCAGPTGTRGAEATPRTRSSPAVMRLEGGLAAVQGEPGAREPRSRRLAAAMKMVCTSLRARGPASSLFHHHRRCSPPPGRSFTRRVGPTHGSRWGPLVPGDVGTLVSRTTRPPSAFDRRGEGTASGGEGTLLRIPRRLRWCPAALAPPLAAARGTRRRSRLAGAALAFAGAALVAEEARIPHREAAADVAVALAAAALGAEQAPLPVRRAVAANTAVALLRAALVVEEARICVGLAGGPGNADEGRALARAAVAAPGAPLPFGRTPGPADAPVALPRAADRPLRASGAVAQAGHAGAADAAVGAALQIHVALLSVALAPRGAAERDGVALAVAAVRRARASVAVGQAGRAARRAGRR